MKKQISFTSVLHHFNLKHQTILKIDASNYVKDEILSQYNDENVLHLMIFYSKSMIFAEINYHIYDKKLLIIIRCFCYDSSYAPMLVAMLMTIIGRSPLGYRVVPRPTLFRVSLCSSESYR